MKRYKLLKDLPTFKAGQLAYISKTGNLIAGTPENQETTETGLIIMIYHETTLKKFPNILTEWFEEIKEPTDNIHWKPKKDDEYFWMNSYGETQPDVWDGDSIDIMRLALGMIYRTEEECERARERKLAEARLRQTSNFKPDFKNGKGGWAVGYDYDDNSLIAIPVDDADYGELVRYATEEDALKSIKENRADWLKYLGIKEEE